MGPPTVFISYSHKDEKWKDRLLPQLKVLQQQGRIVIWDDRKIDAGDQWYDEIGQAVDRAAVVVCLISADFLASDFVTKEEVPHLLERRERDGMIIIPVLLHECLWETVTWVEKTQMIPRDGRCVSSFRSWNRPFSAVAKRIFGIIDNPNYGPPKPPPPKWLPPEKADIDRLPVTGAELFGRRGEMTMLDNAWEFHSTNVVSLVAWGGVGKSTLVNKWLERMKADNYRGARRVYAWSFYSQGTGERVTSADQFIAAALEWFGDPDPNAGSPWNKGERLADLVKQEKNLLILDGMEPLQSALDYEKGKVKDPALGVLITELARENPGLCVITTRVEAPELNDFPETTQQKNLEQISDEAGRALLRVSGVQGDDLQLESATRDFGNHALALNLLAAYLHEIPEHRISHASQIPDLDIPVEKGKHPCRVIAAFEERFGDGPEVELLRMLGLFDHPADKGSIDALRAEPAIPDLTEHTHRLGEGEWLRLLHELRRVRLIAPGSEHNPDVLDAHPLVREHFGKQLRETYPDAWREGNNRLYEHLKATAKELPDTIEEMVPLFAAVAHGCQAGRHQEAFIEVYWQRILRENEFFSVKKLGAIGADLSVLFGFFDPPWSQPVAGLTENTKGFVLNGASFSLRALGRPAEAVQFMQAGLDVAVAQKDWKNAATAASNLSELHLIIGDVSRALDYARQSVELADRSGDAFLRMLSRAKTADVLHQSGQLQESRANFREAEELQQEDQPGLPLLYSLQGFLYCDLLLSWGKYEEVQNRARQTLEWLADQYALLDIALDHLSLGRAHLLQAQAEGTDDFTHTVGELNQAMDGLRQAGQQQYLPLGLLARAELHWVRGDFGRAQRDLDEAMTISTRGGMGLHKADCHLGYARLYLAMGEKEKARESLDVAKEMVESMGYGRRRKDVEELDKERGRGGERETRGQGEREKARI
ncbi:TIR domain-containing protein [Candidatus Poribacteria bacterium]